MSADKNDLPKDVRLVHALMVLRGLSPHELALHTGVQIENLQAWLQGTASALAHRSYIALLSYLGLTRDGLSKAYVQNWEMDVRRTFSITQLEALQQVAPWLVGGTMIEIMGEWQPFLGKTRMFAIRGENFKILLGLKAALRMPCALQPTMVPGLSYRTTEDNKPPEIRVEASYWHAVRNKAITPAEFDDLFFETALECSWNDLRLMARERGITPSMLAKDVLSKDMLPDELAVAKSEVKARKEAVVEQAASASTPVRTRRRAPSERISIEVPVVSVEAQKTMAIPLSLGRPNVGMPISTSGRVPLNGAFVSAQQPFPGPEVSFEPASDAAEILGNPAFNLSGKGDELPGPPSSFRRV
jgi:hypothetical protein